MKHIRPMPLYAVLGKATALWAVANVGYFMFAPVFGYDASYNAAPWGMTIYFLCWAAVGVWLFWDLFRPRFAHASHIWAYGVISMAAAAVVWTLVYMFSLLPALQGPAFAPYTDLLLATPWYFLPKAAELLVQHVIIAALILGLWRHFHSLSSVVASYAVLFGGGHVVLFLLSNAPTPHATAMTFAALGSALIFPYVVLRVRAGFIYSYLIHFVFYIALALVLHAWPPPGYSSVALEIIRIFFV